MISSRQAALKIADAVCPIWVERQNGETGKAEKFSFFHPFIFPLIHLPVSLLLSRRWAKAVPTSTLR